MINNSSLAHPYANAVFDHALSANNIDKWLSDLNNLANLAQNSNFIKLTTNPNLSKEAILEIIVSFVDEPSKELSNFLIQLQDNNKLTILPAIFTLFSSVGSSKNGAATLMRDEKNCGVPLSGSRLNASIKL